jgi:hypothetical protein
VSYPGDFGCEALHVLLLRCERSLRYEEWEIAVLDANLLDVRVKEILCGLPD